MKTKIKTLDWIFVFLIMSATAYFYSFVIIKSTTGLLVITNFDKSFSIFSTLSYIILPIYILIIWILIPLMANLFAVFFNGKGSYKKMLFYWGWCFVIILLSLFIFDTLLNKIIDSYSFAYDNLSKSQLLSILETDKRVLAIRWLNYSS